MENDIELIEPQLFSFNSCECYVRLEETSDRPDEVPSLNLKIANREKDDVLFTFSSSKGLVRKKTDAKQSENILGRLLRLEESDTKSIIRFFEDNGFLFPIKSYEYTCFSLETVLMLIRRIKATIGLYNSISIMEYEKMLTYSAYLIFSPPVEIIVNGENIIIANKPVSEILEKALDLPIIDRRKEFYEKGVFEKSDTTYTGLYRITEEDYIELVKARNGIDSIPGSESDMFQKLAHIYFCERNMDIKSRQIFDFFFRWEVRYGVFRPFENICIDCYGNDEGLWDFPSDIDEEMCSALVTSAKNILENEINGNICGITPKYDMNHSGPQWSVENLMQAIYFSIFYLRPGIQVFKRCENPRCKRNGYFIVNSSCGNKKFCSKECRNAYNSLLRRKRAKELS